MTPEYQPDSFWFKMEDLTQKAAFGAQKVKAPWKVKHTLIEMYETAALNPNAVSLSGWAAALNRAAHRLITC